jgi:membrane-bound metal-dependent hydrolase YbcI (DUF457 family)
MCSPVAHTLIGLSIYTTVTPKKDLFKNWKKVYFICFLTILPDFDFLIMMITHDPSDHRTYTHSLLFSIIAGYAFFKIAAVRYPSFRITFLLSFTLIFSHVVIDGFVGDGFYPSKVALFYPLPYLINSPISIFDPIDWAKSSDWFYSFATFKAIIKEFVITMGLFATVYFLKISRPTFESQVQNDQH